MRRGRLLIINVTTNRAIERTVGHASDGRGHLRGCKAGYLREVQRFNSSPMFKKFLAKLREKIAPAKKPAPAAAATTPAMTLRSNPKIILNLPYAGETRLAPPADPLNVGGLRRMSKAVQRPIRDRPDTVNAERETSPPLRRCRLDSAGRLPQSCAADTGSPPRSPPALC